eukprot:scaffold315324_cov37-Tisochrysis_lutea.AAC.2
MWLVPKLLRRRNSAAFQVGPQRANQASSGTRRGASMSSINAPLTSSPPLPAHHPSPSHHTIPDQFTRLWRPSRPSCALSRAHVSLRIGLVCARRLSYGSCQPVNGSQTGSVGQSSAGACTVITTALSSLTGVQRLSLCELSGVQHEWTEMSLNY